MKFDYDTPEYRDWMNKSDAAEKEVLNQAVMKIEDLYLILNRKLGINLEWKHTIKSARNGGREYLYCESSDIPLDSIGVCRYLFREIQLATFNSSTGTNKTRVMTERGYYDDEYDMSKPPKSYVWMTINFAYEHTGGGSNGHDFATCWFEDGIWKVRFVEEDELITSSKISTKTKNTKALTSVYNKMF